MNLAGAMAGGVRAREVLATLVGACSGAPMFLDLGAHGRTVAFLSVATVAGFAVLIALERSRPLLRRPVVAWLSAALLAVAGLAPPRGSRDLWQYAVYGRMLVVHDVSPYTHVPAEFPTDVFFAQLSPVWHETASLYGPGFTALSGGVVWLTGGGELATRLAFQLLAALCVAAAAIIVDQRTRDPLAVLLVVANPLVIYWTVNAGHNDALIGLALLLAVLAAQHQRPTWAGVAVAAAVLIKPVAGVALLALAWWLWRQPSPGDHGARARGAVRFVCSSVVVTAIGFLLVDPAGAVRALREASGNTSWTSFWRPVALSFDPNEAALPPSVALAALVLIVGIAIVAVGARAHLDAPDLAVVGALLAFVFAAPYTMVWYLAWVVPLVALRWRTRLGLLALAFAGVEAIAVNGFFAGDRPIGEGPAARALHGAELLGVVALVVLSVRAGGRQARSYPGSQRASSAPKAPSASS